MTYSDLDRRIQQRLKDLGFYKGIVDGFRGVLTEQAIIAFKVSKGMAARPYVGPLTLEALFGRIDGATAAQSPLDLPWMNEVAKHMGLHEKRDFTKLFAWLKSDKASVGDPRVLPWCGDMVETAFKLSLPDEPFAGLLAKNPYLARNWLQFGVSSKPAFGAVAVFWRGSRVGLSGHVCFAIGYDPKRGKIRCRGGNQDNAVSDTWLDEDRLLDYRRPSTWKQPLPPLPIMNSAGQPISKNEQ